jgi:serine-type D-Ala-D-Ala carboxypeptidase/endopeptidase (penicillin-binding protein 4)
MHLKLFSISISICIILAGCGTTRTHIKTSQDPFIQLRKNINSVLSDSLFISSRTSIKVQSLEDGKVFFEQDSKTLMNPASNMKLFTSAAALSVLDTNFLFKTSVFAQAWPSNGIIKGDLYLKGYGDPDLRTADLDSLASALRQMGIFSVERNIIVDDSFFDDVYWGAGWMWDDESDPDAPYINALSVNKNCLSISLISDANTIYPYIEPRTDFVTVINEVKVVMDSIRMPLKIRHLNTMRNPNTIIAQGEILPFSQVTRKISLRNPEYYTGTLFKESLQRAGIFVAGEVANNITPNGLRELARLERPMEKVVTNLNKVSDNLSAENTLKILGTSRNGLSGTAKNGTFIVKQFLSSLGIDTAKISIADGSGVSRYNLVSAEQIVFFLAAIYKDPRIFPLFYNSLPIAGIDGTLAKRMTSFPAACNVHAKTGTLNGASCLSGYVLTRDGEMLAFSILMQNFTTSADDYRLAQDRICYLLAGFSRRKTISQAN